MSFGADVRRGAFTPFWPACWMSALLPRRNSWSHSIIWSARVSKSGGIASFTGCLLDPQIPTKGRTFLDVQKVPTTDSCAAANDGELGRRKGETGAFALLIDHHRRGEWVQTARFLFTFLFAVMAIIRCCWFFRWRMPSPPKVLYGVAASQTL